MRFIREKHSKYSNYMSKEKTLFKSKNIKFTIQEIYDPHYLEIRKWVRGEDFSLLVLQKWWQIPLNKSCYVLLKNDPSFKRVPGNIKTMHKVIESKRGRNNGNA